MNLNTPSADGGYDSGYAACPMFWSDRPGSVLLELHRQGGLTGGRALDLGCGEGTNAAWLTTLGYAVDAVEVSAIAREHAVKKYPSAQVNWKRMDVRDLDPTPDEYDLVVAYGLLHCIPERDIDALVDRIRLWTRPGGRAVIVCFNDRSQDLSAHPGFEPTLLPHAHYVNAFADWEAVRATDTDLHETHPHNLIPHHHSMTRMVARKPS